MGRLNPGKLHVTSLNGISSENLVVPRIYTPTHSDIKGEFFLSIGNKYNRKQISGLYTRLMREEVCRIHPYLSYYNTEDTRVSGARNPDSSPSILNSIR
jgi:hypothetical protein